MPESRKHAVAFGVEFCTREGGTRRAPESIGGPVRRDRIGFVQGKIGFVQGKIQLVQSKMNTLPPYLTRERERVGEKERGRERESEKERASDRGRERARKKEI